MKKIFLLTILCLFLFLQSSEAQITLTVEAETGMANNLNFGSLKVLSEKGELLPASSVRTVRISITNTSGKQYKVTQRLDGAVLSEKDIEMDPQAITCFTFGATTPGTLFMQTPTPLSSAEQVVFISDRTGQNDSFQMQYNLEAPADTTGGRYNANIVYNVVVVN